MSGSSCAPGGRLAALHVRTSPSASSAESWTSSSALSATVWLPTGRSSGAEFVARATMSTVRLSVPPVESVTRAKVARLRRLAAHWLAAQPSGYAEVRLSPRLRYGYRTNKFDAGTFHQFQPTLQTNWYPFKHGEVEVEMGGNFSSENAFSAGNLTHTTESGYVLTAGYRLDF